MIDTTSLRTRRHRREWERAIRRLARRAARHAGIDLKAAALLPLIALVAAPGALALPVGGQVVNGNVSISTPNQNTMAITQGSQRGIVNWNSFSIGGSETVNISQPSSQAVLLNRVTGSDASVIAGHLNANGQVFLVNPAGVLFARGASVNVGSIVASTLGISDSDFLAGKYHFTSAQNAGGLVRNEGTITAAERGTVALLGAQVDNSGTVSAKLGTVAMGAGSDITLDFAGDGLTMLKIDGPAAQALASNSGVLQADGGQVLMSVQTADALASTVLNQSGTVRAQSVAERGGRIVLDGGSAGLTEVAGSVDATGGAGGAGGNADITGYHVAVNDGARIDASGGAGGGRVRVGGGSAGQATDIHNADAVWMGPGAQVHADALDSGNGGNVVIYGANAARVYGTLTARGGATAGNGGLIETSARFLDVAGAGIDASALHGVGGTWLLDPYNVDIVARDDLIPGSSGTDGVTFSPTRTNTQLPVAEITNVLKDGVNVTVNTGSSGTDAGNIRVRTSVIMDSSKNAKLTLKAAGSVNIDEYNAGDENVIPRIGVARGSTGKLSVDLEANANGNQPAALVTMNGLATGTVPVATTTPGATPATNAAILTNGGDVTIGGNGGPGVQLSYATIDTRAADGTGGGKITINGTHPSGTGVSASYSLLQSGAGAITVNGTGGSVSAPGYSPYQVPNPIRYASGAGVALSNSVVDSSTGAIALTGHGANAADGDVMSGNGIGLSGATVRSGSGAITLNGFGAASARASNAQGTGVYLSNATVDSGGAVSITGTGAQAGAATAQVAGAGLDIENSTVKSTGSDVTLIGTGMSGAVTMTNLDGIHIDGVYLSAVDIEAAGRTRIEGAAGNGARGARGVYVVNPAGRTTLLTGAQGVSIFGIGNDAEGVALTGGTSGRDRVSSSAGSVDIRGANNGQAGFAGVLVNATDISAPGGSQQVSLTGSTRSTAAPGLNLANTTLSAGDFGTIVVRADTESTKFAAISAGTGTSFSTRYGTLVFVPGSVGPQFVIVADDARPINVVRGNGGFTIETTTLLAASSNIDTIVIGSSTHTGKITASLPCAAGAYCLVASPYANRNITLANGGAGSNGIELPDGLVMGNGRLTLQSAGSVTEGAAGIQTPWLTLTGPGTFTLTSPANFVSTLSLIGTGNVTLASRGTLAIDGAYTHTFDNAANKAITLQSDAATLSGNLVVRVTPDANNGPGVIDVNAPIVKNAGGDATLALHASDYVSLLNNITSSSGALNIVVDAGKGIEAHGYGGEEADFRIRFASNGGNVTVGTQGGGASGFGGAYDVFRSVDIDTRRGTAAGGNVTIHGVSPSPQADVATRYAVDLNDVTINSGTGTIEVEGRSPNPAAYAGGGVILHNDGNPASVRPGATQLVSNATNDANGSAIRVYGSASGASFDNGVALTDGASIQAANGTVDLRGAVTGAGSSGYGVLLASGSVAGANVSVTGSTESATAGIGIGAVPLPAGVALTSGPFSITTGQGGVISLRAANNGNATSLLGRGGAGSVDPRGGTLAISAASVDPSSFGVTAQNGVPITLFGTSATPGLSIDNATYQTFSTNLQTLVLGSPTQTGRITVAGPCAGGAGCAARPTVATNLTLENTGDGSQGIDLPSGIALPANATLALDTTGTVNDPGGIQASTLLLAGGGVFNLLDPNIVDTLVIAGAGTVRFRNAGSFTIGTGSANGVDANGRIVPIGGQQGTLSGDLVAISDNGQVTLGSQGAPMHLQAGGSIDLVMENAVFNNPYGSTLGAGNAWRVWAMTWRGESRNGIDPGGALPNFYGCAYGGVCGWNGLQSMDVVSRNGGNHFVYTERPKIAIDITSQERDAGKENDSFSFTPRPGFVNGDRQNDVLIGSMSSPADRNSPAGTYAINGTFYSPVGYEVTVNPGQLKVNPAKTQTNPLPLEGAVFNRTGLQPLFTAQEQSFVYESNLGGVNVCVGTSEPILALQQSEGPADTLASEWKRVRSRPNLNNCLVVNGQHGCGEF